MSTLLPLFIQVMPELFKLAKDVPVVLDYVKKSKEVFQQEGEWTPEAEDTFTKELEDLKANPPDWWKPEGE
jgi:hypothetical protein